MKKNQKYTREEMFMAIELWKESGLPQKTYCGQNNLSFSTFKYWQKKYQKEIGNDKAQVSTHSFIPVHVPKAPEADIAPGIITISYPNGVTIDCPVNTRIDLLRSLIKL
jgi:transposase-like protein